MKKYFNVVYVFGLCLLKIVSDSSLPFSHSGGSYLKTRNLQSYNFILGSELISAIGNNYSQFFISPLCAVGKNYDENLSHGLTKNLNSTWKIAGDDSPYKYNRDIRAEYLGLESNTHCDLKLQPNQSLYGIKGIGLVPLSNFFSHDMFDQIALGIRTVFTYKEQSCGIAINKDDSTIQKKIEDFFTNKVSYGKIDSKKNFSEFGFESIALTLESVYKTKKNKLKLHYYSGIEIPTTSIYSSQYLFYPTIGNNGHVGLMMGAHAFGTLKETDSYSFGAFAHLENHFAIFRTVKRTFDLYNQEIWSKYLPIINQSKEESYVGDITNLPVRMHPTNNLDISLGVRGFYYKNDNKTIDCSVGYNIWFAQSEYSELRDRPFRNEYDALQLYGIKGSSKSNTSSKSTIMNLAPDDEAFKSITINDLDIDSVCATGGHTQSLFLRLSGEQENSTFSAGIWYEMGGSNIMPSRYGFWLGGGYSW
jgi:hypothetical protein